MFNRCESARDFKHTQWFLCVCESSFVIKFTFDCFSIAIIPSNCSNFLQFLQNKISNYSHIVFNCSIVFLCSVEKSDSIVDLIFIRTTVKKTDCSIAWCNNYRWQTDSSFDFDVVIINSSNSCVVSSRKFLKFRINLISYFFEAVCNRLWHYFFNSFDKSLYNISLILTLFSEYHLRKYFFVCGFKLFTYSRTLAYFTSLQTMTVHFWMKLKSVQMLFLNVHHLLFWLLGVFGYWSRLRTGAFCFAEFWINNATSVKINCTADETLSHNLNNLSRSHSSLTSISLNCFQL